MLYLIARRLALGLLVALTVMTLAFMLTRLSGDLAISIAGPSATQADVDIIARPMASTVRSTSSSSPGSAAP
jgi:ABC-type dipeptide/oligopeptide/nickel transport systems, permease components